MYEKILPSHIFRFLEPASIKQKEIKVYFMYIKQEEIKVYVNAVKRKVSSNPKKFTLW